MLRLDELGMTLLIVCRNVPPWMLVARLYDSLFASVRIPLPTFVSPPPPDNCPEKVVLVLSLPVVRTAESSTDPLPVIEPTLCAEEFMSKLAPELIESAV